MAVLCESPSKDSVPVAPLRPQWWDRRFSLSALVAGLTACCLMFALVRTSSSLVWSEFWKLALLMILLLAFVGTILILSLLFIGIVLLAIGVTYKVVGFAVRMADEKSDR